VSQLETAIQSLKTQLASLRNSIDQECEELRANNLAQIESELSAYKTDLDKVKAEYLSEKSKRDMLAVSSAEKIKAQEQELSNLQAKKWEIEGELSTLDIKKSETYDAIIELQSKVSELTATRDKLASDNDEYGQQSILLKGEIDSLILRKSTLERDHNETREKYDAIITELESKLSRLTSMSNEMSKKIIEEQDSNRKVSENLADWQRKLDEQDRNLRIREQKANQSEQTIIRNHNLLNL